MTFARGNVSNVLQSTPMVTPVASLLLRHYIEYVSTGGIIIVRNFKGTACPQMEITFSVVTALHVAQYSTILGERA